MRGEPAEQRDQVDDAPGGGIDPIAHPGCDELGERTVELRREGLTARLSALAPSVPAFAAAQYVAAFLSGLGD
ncbi:MAG TPA: hypothetical protein VK601_20905, partial [Kofleriaceae bacterium]|nr:hypothetical protein [Kofleriaceae bacterium]